MRISRHPVEALVALWEVKKKNDHRFNMNICRVLLRRSDTDPLNSFLLRVVKCSVSGLVRVVNVDRTGISSEDLFQNVEIVILACCHEQCI